MIGTIKAQLKFSNTRTFKSSVFETRESPKLILKKIRLKTVKLEIQNTGASVVELIFFIRDILNDLHTIQ